MNPPTNQNAPTENISIVSISPFEKDHACLKQILTKSEAFGGVQTRWTIHPLATLESGLSRVKTERIPLFIVESDLEPGTWKQLLTELNEMPERPLLIVTSRVGDEHLWSEVLNFGGWDLLPKPFDEHEVIRILNYAWLHWKHNRTLQNSNEPVRAMEMAAAL